MADPDSTPDGAFDLARLLAPVSITTFREEHWEKQPLLVRRHDRLHYRELFSLDAADELISGSSRASSNVIIVKDGRDSPPDTLAPPEQGGLYVEHVYGAFRAGCTIVMPYVHERWPALARLCAALSAECSTGFQVNAYLTPRGEQGLGTHWDAHDVFVLQVEGSKHWRVFDSPLTLPLPTQPYRREDAEPTAPTQEFDLHAGDLLYLPRGFVHEALATEETSLHLTVGILPLTWAEVVRVAVESVFERSAACRGSLPMGFAHGAVDSAALQAQLRELLDGIVTDTPYDAVIDDAVTRARLAGRPLLRGHLRDLSAETAVTLDTPLIRREGLQHWLSADDDKVCLSFHGKEIRVPGYLEPDLRFIAGSDAPFVAAGLPGSLDEDGRLRLVRRLLREGFVTLPAA